MKGKASLCLLLMCLILSTPLFANKQTIYPQITSEQVNLKTDLQKKIQEFNLFRIDSKQLYETLQNPNYPDYLILHLDDFGSFTWHLYQNDLISETASQKKQLQPNVYRSTAKTYQGFVLKNEGGKIRLTVNENFIYGFWEIGDQTYYIEPVEDQEDIYIVYEKNAVKETPFACYQKDLIHQNIQQQTASLKDFEIGTADCKITQIVGAADYEMYQSVGADTDDVINYFTGGLNNAEANYEMYNIQFDLSDLFVIVTSGPNDHPWPTGNSDDSVINVDDLLDDFRDWAQSSLSIEHDIAILLTGLNVDSGFPDYNPAGTGRAFIGSVCENNRYTVVENFYLGNAAFTRVLMAHEIGHNFGAFHNEPPTGDIMDAVLSNTNTWSSNSFNSIVDHIESRTCLASCACLHIADITTNLCVDEDYEVIITIEHLSDIGDDFNLIIDGVNYPQTFEESPQIITFIQDQDFGTSNIEVSVFDPDDNSGLCSDVTTYDAPRPNETFECIDVENGVFLTDWKIINPDGLATLEPHALGTCASNGDNVLRYNTTAFFLFDNSTTDILESFAFDLSDYNSATLSFDVAYKQSLFGNLNTILDVQISDDCGDNFTSVFGGGKTGAELATVGTLQDTVYWEPNSCNQWRNEVIDLDDFVGENRVVIRFELSTDELFGTDYYSFGPALFLDNICFSGQLDCAPPQPEIEVISQNICGSDPAILEASNIPSGFSQYTYQWYKDNDILIGENDQELATFTTGNYSVVLIDEDTFCPSPASASITIGGPIPVESVPYCVDVETGNLPFQWTINNADGVTTFDVVDADCSSNDDYIIRYDSYFNYIGLAGTTDAFTTEAFDLTNYTDAELEFDLAYKQTYVNRSTILEVAVSDDCGTSFSTLYSKTEADLATVSGFETDEAWEPTSCSEWRTESIDLGGYTGSKVLIRFTVIIPEEWGQNLYLDNICISGTGCNETTWYRDNDDDNFGDANDSIEDCEQPNGYVANADDCDDDDAAINPAMSEICGNNEDDDCDSLTDCEEAICEEDESCIEGFQLNTKIFLEGNYNSSTGSMNNALQESELIPLEQPYNVSPWNYTGNEGVTNANDFPNNTVDWVLVEMRLGTPASTGDPGTNAVEIQAAFLLTNGEIVNTDGEPLIFEDLSAGEDYYLLIRHRNHLDVLSADAIEAENEMSYDFTTGITQAFGNLQQVEADDGTALLHVGDYEPDGVIQNSDNDVWEEDPAILDTYNLTDGTLDGVVQLTDQDAWFPNKAKIGTLEIRF